MYEPGTVFDYKGHPIYPGDILKTYHFTGARKKKYWIYHMVIMCEGSEKMFIACLQYKDGKPKVERQTTLTSLGWFDEESSVLGKTEIIQGYGPGKIISYEDRPRKKVKKCRESIS